MKSEFMSTLKNTLYYVLAITTLILAANAYAQETSLSGAWVMDDRGSWEGLIATNSAQEVLTAFDRSTDDPSMRCVAPALIRTAESQPPFEIIEQDHQILIIYESFNVVRRVRMDGRIAPEWLPLSPIGHSVGTWQGDDLVIETTHLTPHLLNDDGFPFNGGPDARIIEKYSVSKDRLELEFKVEDPINLQGEVAARTFTYDRVPDAMFFHYSCDPLDATGWRLPATGNSLRDLLQWLELRPPIPE
jgi:hypothetical protein